MNKTSFPSLSPGSLHPTMRGMISALAADKAIGSIKPEIKVADKVKKLHVVEESSSPQTEFNIVEEWTEAEPNKSLFKSDGQKRVRTSNPL